MVDHLEKMRNVAIAISPAIFILVLMLIIFSVTVHAKSLFFANSISRILFRFIVITFILILPILMSPRLLTFISRSMKNERFSMQLVIANIEDDRKLGRLDAWFLRPVQGISLALILAERFNMIEASIPLPSVVYTKVIIYISFFLLLTSIFLSVVWAFDDLRIMIYNSKTLEVRMAGSSIGTFLPLVTGAIGVSALYHSSLNPFSALIYVVEIVMVLYPSYVIFVVLQHEFILKHRSVLLPKLELNRVETKYIKVASLGLQQP